MCMRCRREEWKWRSSAWKCSWNKTFLHCTIQNTFVFPLDFRGEILWFYFRMFHIFHSHLIHWKSLRRQVPRRCWTRISSLVEGRPWSCSSAPIGEFSTRPKSSGICCRCPCDCVPNACECWRLSWWGSRGPLGCLVSSRRLSWCEALCCRSQNVPERLHENHEGWYLKKIIENALESVLQHPVGAACEVFSLTDLWWCHAFLPQLLDLFLDIFSVEFQPWWHRAAVGQSGLGNTLSMKKREREILIFVWTQKMVEHVFSSRKFINFIFKWNSTFHN